MNWIPTKTKLPDTTRTVFASDGSAIGMANYSGHLNEWVNLTAIWPRIQPWPYTDEIVLWAEVSDLHKTLPGLGGTATPFIGKPTPDETTARVSTATAAIERGG